MTDGQTGAMELLATGELDAPLTQTEAEELDGQIRDSETLRRLRVWVMLKREGWKRLGFASFDDYCEVRIDTPRATAYRWVQQVETTLRLAHNEAKPLTELKLLPANVTAELSKLRNDPAKMRQAFAEFTGLAEANHQQTAAIAVKRIVRRLQGEDAPAPKARPFAATRPDILQEKMQTIQIELPEMPEPIDPEPEDYADADPEPTELDREALLFDMDIVRDCLKYPESMGAIPVKVRHRIMAGLVELAKYFERGG